METKLTPPKVRFVDAIRQPEKRDVILAALAEDIDLMMEIANTNREKAIDLLIGMELRIEAYAKRHSISYDEAVDEVARGGRSVALDEMEALL